MPRISRFIAALAAVVAMWFAWGWFFPSEEARIRTVLHSIADIVSAGAAEGEMARLGRVARLRDAFHPDLSVDAGPPFRGLQGREAVLGAVARTGGMLDELDVSFSDVAIVLGEDGQAASVTLVAEARFREGQGAGRAYEARELDVRLVRHEGRWVVADVALVGGLRPLQ